MAQPLLEVYCLTSGSRQSPQIAEENKFLKTGMGQRVNKPKYYAASVNQQVKAVYAPGLFQQGETTIAFINPSSAIEPQGVSYQCTTSGTDMSCVVGATTVPLTNCYTGVYIPDGDQKEQQPATFCTFSSTQTPAVTEALKSFQQVPGSAGMVAAPGTAGVITPAGTDNSWMWIVGIIAVVILIAIIVYAIRDRSKLELLPQQPQVVTLQ